ncbi:hypothetical protein [Hespellia stercorisuis]|uniref:Uncharacterized protein n=1 Tax=Hespellia stercorisuis DSM 15480 TaxID=1121950 RepID=A0A1M6M882_9FIRM|nr:hypothetical protein [Hespellia stercorisuis]SHJ79646.1 hypothetical protein SAMN02745243_01401 [Hespellia stercorisuis DSM 15480]
MLKPDNVREDIYQNNYLKAIHKTGKIGNYFCVVLCFIPAILVALVYGVKIPFAAVLTGWLSIASAIGVVWFIEPIANFPIVGSAGTYINVVAGNTSNMRVPCAVMAQKEAGVEPGTPEGSVVSTLGICTSCFVNIPILAVGAILSSIIMNYLPASVLDAFNFLLPALFGAVFVQFAMSKPKIVPVALALGISFCIMVNKGVFSFLGPNPSYVTTLVGTFGTIAFALWMYKKGKI